ncbi:MAG: hypothetical protein FWD17_04785 [Polyangiaceae bacterium]|nr:hypothetical protein [Polyangiaceae bacterium]
MNGPTRRGTGKDPRIVTFRGALESLIESLDATVRIARWEPSGEPIPEPLRHSAEQLQERLGSANRLAAGRFVGAPAVVATSDAIKEAVRDLDAAFVAYRKRADGAVSQRDEAANELDGELGRIKLQAHRWE